MTIQLNRTAVPAMTVVALRGTVPSYSDEGRLWERLMPALQQQGIRPVGRYTQISQAHDLIVQRMEAEGLAARQDGTLASKVFNRYLVTPDQAAPEDLVTEVCRPLA